MTSALVWMRRDLRLHDNAALSYATKNFDKVHLVFVFDEIILNKLKDKKDARVKFIFDTLMDIKSKVHINIIYGNPTSVIHELALSLKVDCVCTNRDYESYAKKRDKIVNDNLIKQNIEFKTFKDTVVFEAQEVLTKTGGLYKVFTPYKNAWITHLESNPDAAFQKNVDLNKIDKKIPKGISLVDSLDAIGFSNDLMERMVIHSKANAVFKSFVHKLINYNKERDFPSIEGTSRLSVHLRFGTISTRELVRAVLKNKDEGSRVWLSELVWREFYFALLDKNPHVEKHAYQKKYEDIPWENNKKLFTAWCEGKTGVPIVDAGMRQLNQTGWMHNRVRMITASYLVKTLLIDWRWGEKYFAQKLIDFDLSANNGGWQWASSTGCDAAPYFRVFNPYRQSQRFDSEGEYIKNFCPELSKVPKKYIHEPYLMPVDVQLQANCMIGKHYPAPIANYKENRIKVINMFKNLGEA